MMVNQKSKNWLKKLVPPPKWQLPVLILVGIMVGSGLTALRLSNAASYLSDDPQACINCHIMTPFYATWTHSSHRQWTNCNDCHVPHDNFFRKYFFKASDGSRHATMFTLRLEPQIFMINEAGKTVVQENCVRCHINVVNPVSAGNVTGENYKHGQGKLCWDCHREVPHGRVSSQASSPFSLIPSQKDAIPQWLREFVKQ